MRWVQIRWAIPRPSIAQALRFDDLVATLADERMDEGTIGFVAAQLSKVFEPAHGDITTEDSPVTFDYDVRTGELLMHYRPSIAFTYEARAALRKDELAVFAWHRRRYGRRRCGNHRGDAPR